MQSKAKTITEYLKELTPVQRVSLTKLRTAIKNNLPEGFREVMNYGMIGYVVPHTILKATIVRLICRFRL